MLSTEIPATAMAIIWLVLLPAAAPAKETRTLVAVVEPAPGATGFATDPFDDGVDVTPGVAEARDVEPERGQIVYCTPPEANRADPGNPEPPEGYMNTVCVRAGHVAPSCPLLPVCAPPG
jgi:hypothetical protein